jgi:hypothetical protein
MNIKYEKLLKIGRENLQKYNIVKYDNMEELIDGLDDVNILKQMIELNKYVYTTASTCYPHNKYFQAMYIAGYMSKSIMNIIKPMLKKNYIAYNFNTIDIDGSISSVYIPKGTYETTLLYETIKLFPNILSKIFGKSVEEIKQTDINVILTWEVAYNIKNMLKINDKYDIIKKILFEILHDNKSTIQQKLHANSIISNSTSLVCHNWLYDSALLFNELPYESFDESFDESLNKILSNDLVHFIIEDTLNPCNRNLYQRLISIFSKKFK